MNNPRCFITLLLLAAFPAILPGCGGSSSEESTGRAAITVHWPGRSRLIPVASESIKVVISNPLDQTVATNLIQRPAGGGDVTVIISPLPAGNLSVTATAYPNADGTGTAQAVANFILHVVPGTIQPITLSPSSTISSVQVSAATLNTAVAGFQQLTATAKNQAGDVVLTLPQTWAWQSDNTAVATVSSTGKVTGVSVGTANITVTETESGKSQTVVVTVGASSGADGLIAFNGVTGVPVSTYTIRGDGSALTEISSGTLLDPKVSPDRQLVAVGYHTAGLYNELGVIRADGSGAPSWRARSNNGWGWSPDSGRIVYGGSTTSGVADGLHIINADGSGDTKIHARGINPSWSPDGTRIVATDESTNQLFLIQPNGTNRQNLVSGYDAKWFPNSQRLAFRREFPGLGWKLFLLNADGTGETPVSSLYVDTYSVSPDGTKIAFSSNSKVYVYTVSSNSAVEIASGFSPAWSPNSAKIAYGSNSGLHFINANGAGDYVIPGVSKATFVDWR